MSIPTALINIPPLEKEHLLRQISKYCPGLQPIESYHSVPDLITENGPEIIFINPISLNREDLTNLRRLSKKCAFILWMTPAEKPIFPLNYFAPHGYLYAPVDPELLILTVDHIQAYYAIKNNKKIIQPKRVGIPTHEGLEFVSTSEIIRCKSLTNCTRIIISGNKKNIISSYNIGAYRKMLEPSGFFCPHKSHLVNLNYVDKYMKEGVIIMREKNDELVPVAKSKRAEFLNLITRL